MAEAVTDQAFLAARVLGPMRNGAVEIDFDDDIAEIKQKRVNVFTSP